MITILQRLSLQNIVLEADYSTALSLLLRYPQPSTPPSTFVKDALYLQNNLTLEGGSHVVFTYSKKRILHQNADSESSVSVKPRAIFETRSKLLTPSPRSNAKLQNSNMKTSLPLPSPARFLQERGGVEGIIKGAIGELRQNVQYLQAGSPPQHGGGFRQPMQQNVNPASPTVSQITSRIDFLEARNKSLARMLEDSLKGLWDHQRVVAEDITNVDVDALSLAIAKVQFVQVYLEDSTMPVPLHGELSQPLKNSETAEERRRPSNSAISGATDDLDSTEIPSKQPSVTEAPNINVTSSAPKQSGIEKPVPAVGAGSVTTAQPSPFHQPRPSLAQSSFSWMLGEDQRRSSFVAASPLSPETRRRSRAKGKVGYLFGDDKSPQVEDPDVSKGESSDVEGFTLGTLKGVKDRN